MVKIGSYFHKSICFSIYLFQKHIFWKLYKVIIHINFVGFPFRISKFKNDINYIKYEFSYRLGKVCRWLNMYYSNIKIKIKIITTMSIWIIKENLVWTYRECNFYQYWNTQSFVHPHVSIWSTRGKVRNKNMGFSIFMIGHCYVR